MRKIVKAILLESEKNILRSEGYGKIVQEYVRLKICKYDLSLLISFCDTIDNCITTIVQEYLNDIMERSNEKPNPIISLIEENVIVSQTPFNSSTFGAVFAPDPVITKAFQDQEARLCLCNTSEQLSKNPFIGIKREEPVISYSHSSYPQINYVYQTPVPHPQKEKNAVRGLHSDMREVSPSNSQVHPYFI